jgi:iron complex outermembrane receptor protein
MKKTIIKSILAVIAVSILSLTLSIAQRYQKCFTIKDTDGNSIPFVAVVVKGTTNGGTTDHDGHICITANYDDIIVVSMVGYPTIEVVFGEIGDIIVLPEDNL